MTDVHTLVADQLVGGRRPVRRPRASRPNASCSCTCCARCARTFRSCSSTPSIISPRPTPIRDEIAERWGLNLVTLRADSASARTLAARTRVPAATGHKVGPLFAALEDYDVWFTGLRREQSPTRAEPRRGRAVRAGVRQNRCGRSARSPGGRPERSGTTRRRTTSRCSRSIDLGYTSIGCEPCTTLPLDPSDERSGRWGGQKRECGIHIQPVGC